MPYQVSPLDRLELDDTLRDYVCSTCWGPLMFVYEDGKWYALCVVCGEETKGYTSKNFAQMMREKSEGELIEAEHNLREVMEMGGEKQSVERNLHDLGF